MADPKTLEQHNTENNISNDGLFPCQHCGEKYRSFALVDGSAVPELNGEYVCATCLIGVTRTKQAQTVETLTWDDVRNFRSRLLAQCDWTQTADASDAIKAQWASIRKSLRDVPQSHPSPTDAYAATIAIEVQYFNS
jgi:hypothetical protein